MQGLLRYEFNDVTQPLLDTWAFEGSRDRLPATRDVQRFDAIISSALRNHYNMEDANAFTFSALLGGLSERAGASPEKALMLRRAPRADFEKIVAGGLKQYEREMKDLNLVLFPEALEAVTRMDRVLSKPGGNLLLVGASGVGRRSALSLLCHMHGLELFTPATTRDYSVKAFKAEKAPPRWACTPAVLLLEDHQMRDDAPIECVNSLLSAGELPGLFEPQELDPMLAPLKEMGAGQPPSLYDFFVHRCMQNLHIALCMDPSNKQFLMRCESNPALYTRCSMLWMGSWSKESMEALAATAMAGLDEDLLPEVQRPLVIKQMTQLHQRLEARGAHDSTPRMYVALTKMWRKIFVSQRQKISDRVDHLRGGLSKLEEAEQEVARLTKTANEQRALLTAKQEEAARAMEQIQRSMEGTVEKRREVEHLQGKLGKEEVVMQEKKAAIEEELWASSRCSRRRGRRWAASRRTTSTRSARSRCRPSRSGTSSRACSRSWATSTRRGSR